MPNDLSIADRCRKYGLRVVEVAGWQTRGRPYDFRPGGSVNHHTAGGPNGTCPSLGGVINGFAGSAPGPLANALQSRELDGNDIIYIIAAGVANHAGVGGWRGLTGNSRVIGLEIEHIGTVPLPDYRQRIAARFHAAMADGRWDAGMVCQHYEWAPPGTKIDAATNVNRDMFRFWVDEALKNPVPQPTPDPSPIPGPPVEAMMEIVVDDMHPGAPAGTKRNMAIFPDGNFSPANNCKVKRVDKGNEGQIPKYVQWPNGRWTTGFGLTGEYSGKHNKINADGKCYGFTQYFWDENNGQRIRDWDFIS